MNLFKRQGKCNQCGFCCEFAILGQVPKGRSELTADDIDYLRRFDTSAVEIEGVTWFVIKHHCKFYDPIGRRCADHPNRPKICKKFPERPDNPYLLIMDKWGVKCGYYFEERE